MALKKVIDKLEEVDEAVRSLYKESNGKFVLDVEDDGRLDEFRNNNKKLFNENDELKKKLALFEGIDPDEAKRSKELAAKMKRKELVESGDIEQLIEAAIAPIRQEFGAKIEGLESVNAKLKEDKKRLLVDNQASELASKHGVVPSAIRNVTYDAREMFSVNDQNEIVSIGPDGTIRRDAQGNPVTMETWIKSLPKVSPHYFASSSGSGAGESRLPMEPGKIAAGDNEGFVQNVEAIASGKMQVVQSA